MSKLYVVEYTINGETTTEAGPFKSIGEARRVAKSFSNAVRGDGYVMTSNGDTYAHMGSVRKLVAVVAVEWK